MTHLDRGSEVLPHVLLLVPVCQANVSLHSFHAALVTGITPCCLIAMFSSSTGIYNIIPLLEMSLIFMMHDHMLKVFSGLQRDYPSLLLFIIIFKTVHLHYALQSP